MRTTSFTTSSRKTAAPPVPWVLSCRAFVERAIEDKIIKAGRKSSRRLHLLRDQGPDALECLCICRNPCSNHGELWSRSLAQATQQPCSTSTTCSSTNCRCRLHSAWVLQSVSHSSATQSTVAVPVSLTVTTSSTSGARIVGMPCIVAACALDTGTRMLRP